MMAARRLSGILTNGTIFVDHDFMEKAIKNVAWHMIMSCLGINLARGILYGLGIKLSYRDQLKERIVFAKIQPVDIDLGARHL